MTRELKFREGTLRIILPGTWGSVPLSDPDTASAYIKKLVKKQVGKADRLARVRREAAQEILLSARDAALAGVHTYLMSMELLPGIPFPAAILAVDEEWSDDAHQALEAGDLEAALRMRAPGCEVATQRNGPVARVVEMVNSKVTEGGTEFLTMRLEYHIPYPDRSKLLLARVNVPNIPSAEPFATLFDEILDSVVFMENSGVEDAKQPGRTEAAAMARADAGVAPSEA